MMFKKYVIPAIAILLCVAATARAMELPHLGISGSANACCCAEITRSVLPAYNEELYACMRVANSNDKVRVVFTWYAPDGTVYSSTVKVGFPSGSDEDIKVWDGVNPGGMEGWWRIEAASGGEILSKKLLLTRNRQILTVLDGNKDARIRVLRNANLLKPEGEDTVVIAMEDPEPEVRAAAVTVVRGLAEPWAADIVKRGLSDTGHGVRLAAARLAGMLPESEREAACLPLVGDQDPEMRLAAIAGLKGLGGANAADALAGALDDPVAAVRLEALRELVLHGGPRLAEALPRLAADSGRDVARAAVDAAVSLDESGLRSDALIAAAQGPHRDIARRAVDLIIEERDPRAAGACMEQFMEGYRRQDILDAVGAVQGTGAVGPLAGIYRSSPENYELRLGAVQYLGGRGPSALPVLKEALADRNPAVSLAAVKAMGTSGDTPGRTEALRSALKSAVPPVRRAALDVLSGSALPESALAMVDALEDIELRGDALEYAARSNDGRVISALADAASNVPDAGFRARVVSKLAGAGLAGTGLQRFLADPAASVRLEAARGIAAGRGVEAAYGLLVAGGDPDAAVREEALSGLKDMDKA
ncbi:MAG TPA: HEAT repeat domain-containing protein, partial [Nitrospirota bacterium]